MKNLSAQTLGQIKPLPVTSNSKIRKAFSRKPSHILVTLLSVSLLLISQFTTAQAPQQFSFQGVARDVDGKILANKGITVGLDIHEGSANGNVLFTEEHNVVTNANGIFNLQIGSLDNLSDIDWGRDSYFLQTRINYDGLPTFIDLGTTKLLSVPYSLYSKNSNKADQWVDGTPVVQSGIFAFGPTLPDIGMPGPKLIWYPRKGAFRVGLGNSTVWGDSQIGESSFSTGNLTLSSGTSSAAFGQGTVAKAYHGFSLGSFNDDTDNPNGAGTSVNDRIFQIGVGISQTRKNALTVLRNGNIGIGNNVLNPAFALDIGARARVRHNPGGLTAGIYFDNSQNTTEGFVGMLNDNEMGFFSGNAWRLLVNKNGTVSAATFQNWSDRRLKTGINPIRNSLLNLRQIRGYNYHWKDNRTNRDLQTGVIAQEIEKAFPELVSVGENGYKSVNYIGLIPHLIEAVKELDKRTDEIAQLKKELAEVKEINKRMIALEAGLKSLLTGNTSAIGKSYAK